MIALAGLAEAVLSMQLLISYGGLLLIFLCALFALTTGNRWLIFLTILFTLLFGYFLAPWKLPFITLSKEDQVDKDNVYWFRNYQIMAIAWYIVLVGVTISCFVFCAREMLSRNKPETSIDGEEQKT